VAPADRVLWDQDSALSCRWLRSTLKLGCPASPLTWAPEGHNITVMSAIAYTESPRWQTSMPIVDMRTVRTQEAFQAIGVPPERSGASIVDEFAEDLRQLADA
jgi:hypothetical protein